MSEDELPPCVSCENLEKCRQSKSMLRKCKKLTEWLEKEAKKHGRKVDMNKFEEELEALLEKEGLE